MKDIGRAVTEKLSIPASVHTKRPNSGASRVDDPRGLLAAVEGLCVEEEHLRNCYCSVLLLQLPRELLALLLPVMVSSLS